MVPAQRVGAVVVEVQRVPDYSSLPRRDAPAAPHHASVHDSAALGAAFRGPGGGPSPDQGV